MRIKSKWIVSAAALLAVVGCPILAKAMPAQVQDQVQAAPAPNDNYDRDLKCLGVYIFMAVAERAVPPAKMKTYADLIRGDGHALNKSDDQIKKDMQAAVIAYAGEIKAAAKDDKVPADAGLSDYHDCNAYFAGRGVSAANPDAAKDMAH